MAFNLKVKSHTLPVLLWWTVTRLCSSRSGGNRDARRENTPAPLETTLGRRGLWDLEFFCVHHHSCFFFLIRGVKNYKYQEEKEEEEEELSMGLDLGRFDQCYRFNKKLT